MQINFPLVSLKVWIYSSTVLRGHPQRLFTIPFSKKHVNEIKTQITMYNKFDTKVPIFAISEDPKRPNYIFPHCPKKWKDIQNFQFLIVGG